MHQVLSPGVHYDFCIRQHHVRVEEGGPASRGGTPGHYGSPGRYSTPGRYGRGVGDDDSTTGRRDTR